MKIYSFFIISFLICFYGLNLKAQMVAQGVQYKAQKDTAFANGSGIASIKADARVISNLTLLGQVWGFAKYHLPVVAKGNINMDAELFRVMPKVIKAQTKTELCYILEKWIDNLGKPEPCGNCKSIDLKGVMQTPDYGSLFDTGVVTPSLIGKLTYILDNRNMGENYYIKLAEGAGNPVFQNELSYTHPAYPDAGVRVLALFRYWNMIQYFAPYKNLTDTNWNLILPEYLPQFINAGDEFEYDIAAIKIISSLHDSHAALWDWLPGLNAHYGEFKPPFRTDFIENKLVVTAFYNDAAKHEPSAKIGDVITAINGERVDALIKKFLPVSVGSNYEGQLANMSFNYLLRSKDSIFYLTVDRNGAPFNVKQPGLKYYKLDYKTLPTPKDPGYYVIDDNVGYIYGAKYHEKDLEDIGKTLMGTKGIIIDMRCYPPEGMENSLVPYIKSGNAPFVKVFRPNITEPGVFRIAETITVPPQLIYKGKVVVIVNKYSLSEAEFTTMAFQSSPNVTVIGSTTAGADGNISEIVFPGGIITHISGLGYLYPDGTQTQRVGVKINEVVKPTIEGIKAGRDELLERAKQIILN